MSAEVALLTQIDNNTDFYVVSDTLFDPNLMLDMSGAFPKSSSNFTLTVDTHDIFEDGSSIATYQFNDNATDLGGNYDASASNITYELGKYDNAGVFNGTNSIFYANVLVPIRNTIKAVSFNVYLPTDGTGALFEYRDYDNWDREANLYYINSTKSFVLEYRNSANVEGINWFKQSTPALLIENTWCTVTLQDGINGQEIWVNGVKQTLTDTFGTSQNLWIDTVAFASVIDTILIGADNRANTGIHHVFNGKIDQVRIFNRALIAEEIMSLCIEVPPKIVLDLPQRTILSTIDLVDPFSDSSGVSLYQFNDDATDVSGTYNAIPVNITYGVGKFDNASVFNGSSSYVTYPAYALGDNFTVSAWVNPTDFNNYAHIFSNWTQNNFAIKLTTIDGFIYVYTVGTGSLISTLQLSLGVWSFVAVEYNTGTLTIYLNDTSYSFSTTLNIPSETHVTGRRGDVSSEYFNGSIDQVRVFNRALTAEEINSIYNEKVTL